MADMSAVEEKSNVTPIAGAAHLSKSEKAPLAFLPHDFDDAWRIAKYLEASQLTPDALRGKPYDLLYIIVTGVELGLSPMQAVRDIVIIKGKPYLSALLRVALVKKSAECEYFRCVHSDSTKAIFETKRKGEGVTKMEFNVDDARRAQLLDRKDRDGKLITDDNWTKYLPVMLRRRAASQLADEVYPDVMRGSRDREELDEEKEVNPAPVARIGLTVAPPPEDAQVVEPKPKPTPPKVEAPPAVTPDPDTTPPDMPAAQGPSEYELICIALRECQTVAQVDDLSMKHVKYAGPERSELTKLFRERRKALAPK